MQGKLIIPFATALLTQYASALNASSGLPMTPDTMQFAEVAVENTFTKEGHQQLAQV